MKGATSRVMIRQQYLHCNIMISFTFALLFLMQNGAREKKSDVNKNLESNRAVHKENKNIQRYK